MALHIHRSERADALVEALAGVLGDATQDPFTPEVVAVPARGVERWLTQRLSHSLGAGGDGDGVCANVQFPSPSAVVADAISRSTGVDPDDDPWGEGRVVWTLLDVIDGCAAEPWCSVLGRHLGINDGDASPRRGRRYTAAQHLAGLFGSYGAQRPNMLLSWVKGNDTDGVGAPLAHDVVWQAELWRRLRDRIGEPSPAERLGAVCRALRQDRTLIELPGSLSLFGPTRMTADQVDVLGALAEHRDVHLWLLHPSVALWDTVAPLAVASGGDCRRRQDLTVEAANHPLLLSLGRDAREMQLLLAADDQAVSTDEYHPVPDARPSLLGLLQHGLRTNTAPPGAPLGDAEDTRPLLDPKDRSLQVHACHGRDRQVEVLREVLLGLLDEDTSLEPRDVLVMCPDIETYAPFISATFGLADADQPPSHPGHGLRVRLADRSLRQTNPLLSTVAELLELADGRVTASQVLDLAGTRSVSRRFGLDEDDLERVRDWVGTAGVRWGLDAAHRAPFHMEGVTQNTWRAGLDRVLLGVTMSEDDLRWVGLALPLDDVDSNDVDLAGRFAELVDRLSGVLDSLNGVHPLTHWLDALGQALDALSSVSNQDAWQLTQARRELAGFAAAAGGQADTVTLALADVRALLTDRLKGRPTRAGFRTGDLTMCSMVPMRSVPHRVICLLGLDDGVFPRTTGVDGDDILARDPCIGERDRRSEDRQLLLDAILAAEEHLVILYTGANERTNTVRPPAVPVGEILDVVDATVRTDQGPLARDRVVVRQPLQPFDARNFTPAALGARGPFSFDRSALAGARAAAQPRVAQPPFLAAALAGAEDGGSVELRTLIQFLEHPVRQFLRQRLGVTVPEEGDELDDALHADLGSLKRWAVGDRWLQTRLGGADVDSCVQAEWRRGELPPGALGERLLDNIQEQAEPLLAAGATERVGDPASVDIAVPLPDGRVLTGTVAGLYGTTLSRTVFSKLGPKYRLRAWVQLLVLAAASPGTDCRAVTIGRNRLPGIARSVLRVPPPDAAAATLATLVGLRDRGLCEPLPLPLGPAYAYADVRRTGDNEKAGLDAAERSWKDSFEGDRDRHHAYVWGPDLEFDRLLDQRATADDQAIGARENEKYRFGALACRLWWPMLEAETLVTP